MKLGPTANEYLEGKELIISLRASATKTFSKKMSKTKSAAKNQAPLFKEKQVVTSGIEDTIDLYREDEDTIDADEHDEIVEAAAAKQSRKRIVPAGSLIKIDQIHHEFGPRKLYLQLRALRRIVSDQTLCLVGYTNISVQISEEDRANASDILNDTTIEMLSTTCPQGMPFRYCWACMLIKMVTRCTIFQNCDRGCYERLLRR